LIDGPLARERGKNTPPQAKLFVPLELELAEIDTFGSVSIMAHVSVYAASIKKWRAALTEPIRTDDGLAGTNVGYLASEQPRWLEVNLANPDARSGRIAALIDLISNSGFRYFDRFRRPDEVVNSIIAGDDPGMMDYMAIEYAVCYGSRQDGLRVLARYLDQWP
jgi:hypothetical protein